MIYDFNEMKKQNDSLENKLVTLKEEYKKTKMSEEQLEKLVVAMGEANMADRKAQKKLRKLTVTAAAIGIFMILPNTSATVAHAMEQIPVIGSLVQVVTFRDYQYELDRSHADIKVPEMKLEGENKNSLIQAELEKTTVEINDEIKRITDEVIEQFETSLAEDGYQEVIVNSEVIVAAQDYVTLKLSCYQGEASGYQWNEYYTIDLNTGKHLQLKDLFVDGADYIKPISENIKEQMQSQMDADEEIYYWLHDEMEELNFKTITDETSFYVNESGSLVIAFDEGEVAPMYMGEVEFEIPAEVLDGIRLIGNIF